MYTQFNTLSFCIDVDDSYITYIGGFKVNMSVNDFYLLMRTKHVFCFFNCLFKPTLVYHISIKAWFYCILYGSSLWRIFWIFFWAGRFVLNELFYLCWSTLIIRTLVPQHGLNYTFCCHYKFMERLKFCNDVHFDDAWLLLLLNIFKYNTM